jgi:hypothetical protein
MTLPMDRILIQLLAEVKNGNARDPPEEALVQNYKLTYRNAIKGPLCL